MSEEKKPTITFVGPSLKDLLADTSTVEKPRTFSFSDFLVGNNKPPVPKAQVKVIIPQATVRKPKVIAAPTTVFQATIPKATEITGESGDRWNLRCFCDCYLEQGFMIQCERCECWQHAKCVNELPFKLTDHYTCPICAHKHIRCSCDDNLDYTLPLIRCTKCKYFVHRQCEGLDIGPVNPDTYVCKRCGGTFQQLPDVFLPNTLPFQNPKTNLTKTIIENLHPAIRSTPFYKVLLTKLVQKDLTLFHFLSVIYNELRSFFYITHPSISFQTVRKRRSDVATSFYKCLFYIANQLFYVNSDQIIALIDNLAKLDLYKDPGKRFFYNNLTTEPIQVTENAQNDFNKLKHLPEIPNISQQADLIVDNNGVFCKSELQPEQLVCILSGWVGLSDEFNYDRGIELNQFSIFSSKFIIDIHDRPQIGINFHRSLNPNCIVKLFQSKNNFYVGIFSGISDANGIDSRTRRGKFSIPSMTELTLPIDFPPGTLIEPIDYMSWHFDLDAATDPTSSPPPQQDTSLREARRIQRAMKEATKLEKIEKEKEKQALKKKKKKEKEMDKPNKKRLQKEKAQKKEEPEENDSFLFGLFSKPDVGPPLIQVYARNNEEEQEMEQEEEKEEDQIPEISKSTAEMSKLTPKQEKVPVDEISVPVDLSFLDKMRNYGDCSYQPLNLIDPTEEFRQIMRN
ncbi:PHD-finger family protein [Trichomonas vaginalis G3]|uniref:PHD-finger family protein n=1 Tax=Trichomonas vaginalis (strain ATCC PRA-98 / G3) TaxID=412133 RepID=A2FUK1_TRIV3|nr:UPSET, isoform A family [Trichomonas vaginalis G3]EAX91408.1 PHD-finger family protein [Trichomonas vaginalis G3]KAI5540966.1 UPSET, isoform A family [Trichomonas vaginalis G3]|eukprot:XP_001304338.1 PHD-finger family protein [Trichomonas vaginalis G3]